MLQGCSTEILIEWINGAFVVMKEEKQLGPTTVEMSKRCRACMQMDNLSKILIIRKNGSLDVTEFII